MPRSVLRSACALLVLALSACDSTSDPEGVAGTYSLHVVNGVRPPVGVWAGASGTVQVVDAEVRLARDGAASVVLTTRTGGTEQSTTYAGTYRQKGDVLELGFLETAQGERVRADGVVISGREVAVALMFARAATTGYQEFPVAIIARR